MTSNAERQARAHVTYPRAHVVETVDELWGTIDLLVVATPNRAHVPLGLAAVDHGRGGRGGQAPGRVGRLRAGADRRGRAGERAAHRVSEPAPGRRLPHRPQGGGGGRAGHRASFRIALRALPPGRGRGLARAAGAGRRRRAAARPRRPPRGSGAASCSAIRCGSMPRSTPAGRARRWRTTCSSRSSIRTACALISG